MDKHTEKKCLLCGILRPLSEYYYRKEKIYQRCKICVRLRNANTNKISHAVVIKNRESYRKNNDIHVTGFMARPQMFRDAYNAIKLVSNNAKLLAAALDIHITTYYLWKKKGLLPTPTTTTTPTTPTTTPTTPTTTPTTPTTATTPTK
jgi:hypothetical protein